MRCRAMQALWKLALEPVEETLADREAAAVGVLWPA
jgi:hypothetical protein